MFRLRSLRNKLALLFFAITAAAFAVIYFVVVPQLESNLESRRLQDLRRSAVQGRAPLEEVLAGEASSPAINRRVRIVQDATDARVTRCRTAFMRVAGAVACLPIEASLA